MTFSRCRPRHWAGMHLSTLTQDLPSPNTWKSWMDWFIKLLATCTRCSQSPQQRCRSPWLPAESQHLAIHPYASFCRGLMCFLSSSSTIASIDCNVGGEEGAWLERQRGATAAHWQERRPACLLLPCAP